MKLRKQKTSFLDLKHRFNSKYKKLKQLNYNFLNTNKVLKLHRPKWNFLKRKNKVRFYHRIFSNIDNNLLLKKVHYLEPIKHPKYMYRYKLILNSKRLFRVWYFIKRLKVPGNLYHKKISFISNNKIFCLTRLTSLIFQFETRLDVIILRLFFFPSLYHVQKLILQKTVLVNKKYSISFNSFLQIGDLIEFKTSKKQIYDKDTLNFTLLFSNSFSKYSFKTFEVLLNYFFKYVKQIILSCKKIPLTRNMFNIFLKLKIKIKILYNFLLNKCFKQKLKQIKIKNKFFYNFFSLNRMLYIYINQTKKQTNYFTDKLSLNLLLKKYLKKKKISKYLKLNLNNPFFLKKKQSQNLDKLNLMSRLKSKRFFYYKNLKTKTIYRLFKNYILVNNEPYKQIKFVNIDKTRSLILYNLKKTFSYQYKPKFLMLLNYLHLEVNYNILTIRIQQPFLNKLQLKVLYPFRFNYHILQEYFDNNH